MKRQRGSVLCFIKRCFSGLHSALQCFTKLYNAFQCFTLLYSASQCFVVVSYGGAPDEAVFCFIRRRRQTHTAAGLNHPNRVKSSY